MIIRTVLLVLLLPALTLAGQWVAPGDLKLLVAAHADDDRGRDDDDDDDRDRRRPRASTPRRAAPAHEIIAIGLTAVDAERLRRAGFRIIEDYSSGLLGGTVSRIAPPARLGAAPALRRARALAPGAEFARNDPFARVPMRYRPAGESCGEACESFQLTAWTSALAACTVRAPLGVIDTAVDLSHDSLKGADVTARTLRGAGRAPSSADHGTAVVSLLAGRPGTAVAGLMPAGRILAADAFHKAGGADTADAFDIARSLDWLASEQAGVINLSLSGPDNAVLRRAVAEALRRGIIVVAAAGLPERGGTNGFPARYEGVVAVSAVDGRLRPSHLAARGGHIAFAAPGVGVTVAVPGNRTRRAEGTSFAAPFVAAAYAMSLDPAQPAGEAGLRLAQSARDLGAPGRDPIYGWGLIQYGEIARCRS